MLERAKAWKSSLLSDLSRGGVFRLQWTHEALQSTELTRVGEEDSIFLSREQLTLTVCPELKASVLHSSHSQMMFLCVRYRARARED